MSVTPRIAAPVLEPGQAIPETTVNEITRYLEAVAAGVVVDKDLTAPAGTESDGDCYIIPASATGAWAGQDDSFAIKISTGWVFVPPFEGMTFYVQDEATDYRYVSGAWGVDSPAGLGTASTLDFDTDGTLAANSDAKLATQKAVRTYIAAAVAGLLDYKGATDCSANPNFPAASKGDAYVVSVAGKIGGASGQSVEAGDFFFAKADNAGGTDASVGASWDILQFNALAYALLSGATFTGAVHVPDDAYDATGWNGSTEVPTKNALRDKIEAIVAGVGTAASTTEQLTGTDATKLSTPDSVAALWEQGADVASAATVSLGEGGYFNITGTTAITDVDFATDKAGRKAWVKFAGALTLTHNASTLILPTGANIVTAAGDTACFISEGSDVVRCVAYQRASGQALASATQYYRIGFFFTTTPAVSEVVALHVVTDAFTLPANFATPDSKGSCGTNPTASFALDVQKNGSSIGTITISTGGAFTFATTSGTSKSIAAGDVIKIVAPSPVDATCANVAITLKGTI